ncbi:MAG: PQQ-binding-like beta-propeller repeat protein [Actinomycetota bacterium]
MRKRPSSPVAALLVAAVLAAIGVVPQAAPAKAAKRHRATILFSPEGNRLHAYTVGKTPHDQVVIHSKTDDPKHGLDINAQICFKPGTRTFIAGEDTHQDEGRVQGWSTFRLSGDRVGNLSAKRIGRLEPTYQSYTSPDTVPDQYGCGFLPDGRLLTTDIGDRYPGLPGDGQLIVWFPPYDTKHVRYCKIDVQLPTPGGIYIDAQQHVYAATNRAGQGSDPHLAGIYRYSPPFPTSDTVAGGCDGTDSTGAPMTTSVQRDLFIPGDDNIPTPSAITRSRTGTFYVSSVFNGVIAEYDADGSFIRRVLEPPPGDSLPYETGTPYGLAVTKDGTLYYADLAIGPGPPPDAESGKGTVRRIRFVDGDPQPPELVNGELDYPDGLGLLHLPIRKSRPPMVTSARTAAAMRGGPWRTYGRSAGHTFSGPTTLTSDSVPTLQRVWFVPTDDIVTADPIVVGKTVYAGSWDGFFRAIDLATGDVRWKFRVKDQDAVTPHPGARSPADVTSDGGLITSSATYVPRSGRRPALVVFGGGYTLYALRAATGKPYWTHDYTGRPDKPPNPDDDPTRIFSSPIVVGRRILFGVTPDGSNGYRGYFVSASLRTGKPRWIFETDVNAEGKVKNDGCGGVWSSGTVDLRHRLVFFDTSDCDFQNRAPYDEAVIALHVGSGKKAWVFKAPRADADCDWDFGATPNFRPAAQDRPGFLGVGSKDGTYYSLAPSSGKLRWKTNVVFGGFAGGFIATAAYDGERVYGATALGDFGRFEGFGSAGCEPGDPNDRPLQEPSLHAFDAKTGDVVWQQYGSQSFAPATVAGGMVFVCPSIHPQVDIRSSENGMLLSTIPLESPCWSPITVVGNAVLFGTGSSEQSQPAGISLYTPGGAAPKV